MDLSKLINKDFVFRIKASILIALSILLFYLILSEGNYFILPDKLMALGFNLSNLHNIFSFIIIHTGYLHLLVNLLSFIVFAILVELSLSSIDVILIFLLSQIGAALVFCFLNPDKTLIGASAGISGLVAVAIALKPVKAIIAMVLVVAALLLIFFPATNYSFDIHKQNILNEQTSIERDLNLAVALGDVNAAIDLNRTLQQSRERIVEMKEGEIVQKQTKTDFWIHGYGAFFGVLYIFLFRRNKVKEALKGIKLYKEKIKKF